MKDVRAWLNELPSWCRNRALIYNSRYDKKFTKQPDSLCEALVMGFKWNSTVEGRSFWENVYNDAKRGVLEERTPKVVLAEKPPKVVYEKIRITFSKSLRVKNVVVNEEKVIATTFKNIDSALEHFFSNKK